MNDEKPPAEPAAAKYVSIPQIMFLGGILIVMGFVLYPLISKSLPAVSIGPSSPSESAGRTVLEHRIERQSGGKIKLLSFRKTNASSNENLYRMEYEGTIQFLEVGVWKKGGKADSHIFYYFALGQVGSGFGAQVEYDVSGATDVKQGQTQTIQDNFDFQKTERGWKGEDDEVY